MKHEKWFLGLLLVCLGFPLAVNAFDRQAAVAYADKYALSANRDAYGEPFASDCANFVSQAFAAGNLKFGADAGEKSPQGMLIRANELGPALTTNHGASTVVDYGAINDLPASLPGGDPMFLMRLISGSREYFFDAKTHAMLIAGQSPLVFNAHTNDRYHYPFTDITDWTFEVGLNWLRYFHIPTGPIIKYAELVEVKGGAGTQIFEYKYDSDYEPDTAESEYYSNAYNGLAPTLLDVNSQPVVSTGELRLKIIFDATINQNTFAATFGKTPSFNDFAFTAVGWSSTHQPLDTWEGKATLSDSSADIDGANSIRINAFSADGSQIDNDGDLSSYSPGPDARLGFMISNVFAVIGSDGSDIAPDGFANAGWVSVTGPYNTARIVLSGPSQQEAVFSVGDSIVASFSPVYEGSYTVSAYDTENNQINSLSFTNDLTKPWVSVPGLAAAATTETSVTVQAEDYGSGIDRIVLDGPTGSTRTFSGGQAEAATFSGLLLGAYTAWVYDRAGNSGRKSFWVTEPTPGSLGETPDMVEASPVVIPMPGPGPASYGSVDFIKTLPDGSRYIAVNKVWEGGYLLRLDAAGGLSWVQHEGWEWDSRIYGLETDADGNAYVLADNSLYKFTPAGGNSAVADLGENDPADYGETALASDKNGGRVYAYTRFWDMESGYNSRLSAFDTGLNLLSSTSTSVEGRGGVFVDAAGDVWFAGFERDAEENEMLTVSRYGAGLIGSAVHRQWTEINDADHDGVYMPAAADPRGGIVVLNNGVFWRVDAAGFGIPAIARLGTDSPFVVDSDGAIFGVAGNPENGNASVVKISTDNAYVWEPPYVDTEAGLWPMALSLMSGDKLDVAVLNDENISISRYAPVNSAVSEDGLASVVSVGEDVSVAPAEPVTYAAAAAAVSDSGLLSVTTFYAVSSGSGELPLPAQITLAYSPETVYEKGLVPSAIYLFEYDTENGWVYMEDQRQDEDNNRITARIMGAARVFAILGEPGDYSAPLVELSVNGVAVGDGETINIAASDLVTLSAQDVGYAGVREIVYTTDPEFSDETLYESSFSLAEGMHTIYYQAVDNAFNFSDVKAAHVNVAASAEADTTPPAGITDLSGQPGVYPGAVTLFWTATGDDGASGDISKGKIRVDYSQDPAQILPAGTFNFEVSTNVAQGTAVKRHISGLQAGATYYFSVRLADEAGNLSAASNIAAAYAQPVHISSGPGTIMTIAGGWGDGSLATNISIPRPSGLALDSEGNLYFNYSQGDQKGDYLIRKVNHATGRVETVAGTVFGGYSGDGGLAINAQIFNLRGIALDAEGNGYIVDYDTSRIRKIGYATGIITTIAGTGTAGYAGDGGLAVNAQLERPYDLAADKDGNLYFTENNARIRKIDSSGFITTIAGTGEEGFSGDGGLATDAQVSAVGIAVDQTGDVYVVSADRVRKISKNTGVIATIAGGGVGGDGEMAVDAQLVGLTGAAVDLAGNVYIIENSK